MDRTGNILPFRHGIYLGGGISLHLSGRKADPHQTMSDRQPQGQVLLVLMLHMAVLGTILPV